MKIKFEMESGQLPHIVTVCLTIIAAMAIVGLVTVAVAAL